MFERKSVQFASGKVGTQDTSLSDISTSTASQNTRCPPSPECPFLQLYHCGKDKLVLGSSESVGAWFSRALCTESNSPGHQFPVWLRGGEAQHPASAGEASLLLPTGGQKELSTALISFLLQGVTLTGAHCCRSPLLMTKDRKKPVLKPGCSLYLACLPLWPVQAL